MWGGSSGCRAPELFHPRAEVPEHLDHHRARQGRRDPRLPQHLPASGQQDAVAGRPVPGGAGTGAAAVLPVPRLALQPGWLAALGHAQGSVARLRRRQLPRASGSVRGVGRLHLHQPQPAQHRAVALLSRRARPRHRRISVRRAAPGVSVQNRIAVQLEDLRRRLRGELPRPVFARVILRQPDRRGEGGAGQAEPVHRRAGLPAQAVRIGCSLSPESRPERRRTPSRSSA